MRDVSVIPLTEDESMIVAVDNSGAVGMKAQDEVQVPYAVVSYFAFRTAVMECISAGGHPFIVIIHNFCGNDAWAELVTGVKKGLKELNFMDVQITGSTETNFQLKQSTIGLTVLGKKAMGGVEVPLNIKKQRVAVIGSPLVGEAVRDRPEEIASLHLFDSIAQISGVTLFPVGSKGILYELNQAFSENMNDRQVQTDVDIMQSSGPSTCFIAIYPKKLEDRIQSEAGSLFHLVQFEV
ncbi:ATP-binding protein [Sporolactobacillus sp. THM19-2]|uniref:ATP-binding protein n=1 Tax=Sporolactobacillus sp. THM19-2 TaxID=2511171 RepID=UPI0010209A3E|nr:ATP-binding protein [Sporolactobacillus sp. THM19-2]RYL88137.1 ATP-binding protein [Sporolactobacillus sp. THM19-2]